MDNAYLMQSKRHPEGYMSKGDSLLDGFTVKQLIDALHSGEPIIDETAVRRIVKDMLKTQISDMNAIIDENMEEIIAAAYKGRDDDPNKGSFYDHDWADRAEKLAKEIYDLCIKYGFWIDVAIYYNGKRMSSWYEDDQGKTQYDYNGKPHFAEGYDAKDHFEYVRDPNILSMSFEGPVYEAINGCGNVRFVNELCSLFSKYGLYYEMGNAWNLSAYEV